MFRMEAGKAFVCRIEIEPSATVKGYVQEPVTSDFKTAGRGEATGFILIILPLPLGEGWGEGAG